MSKIKHSLSNYIAALRLPFIMASILPFIAGSLILKSGFKILPFLLGLLCVTFTHLGANLLNDYADSKSGVDYKDLESYKLFGGSKLIQKGIFSENFYLALSIYCFIFSFACAALLSLALKNILTLVFYILAVLLSLSYSSKPFQFCYRRLGEFIIFILFGPCLVMGGFFIQTQIFPSLNSFLLSLPFGLFTTLVLFSNEVPDFKDDKESKKFTWVSIIGPEHAYIVYCILVCLGYISIYFNIVMGYLSSVSMFTFIFILALLKAAFILKKFSRDKFILLESSRLTILVQAFIGIILVLDLAI